MLTQNATTKEFNFADRQKKMMQEALKTFESEAFKRLSPKAYARHQRRQTERKNPRVL